MQDGIKLSKLQYQPKWHRFEVIFFLAEDAVCEIVMSNAVNLHMKQLPPSQLPNRALCTGRLGPYVLTVDEREMYGWMCWLVWLNWFLTHFKRITINIKVSKTFLKTILLCIITIFVTIIQWLTEGFIFRRFFTCSAISCLFCSNILCCSLVWSTMFFPPTRSLLSIAWIEKKRRINTFH